MCGISAAIGSLDPDVIDGVRRMSLRQQQRGPDAAGEWIAPGNGMERLGAMLAFRRLKIIDLSDSANQPMIDAETGNVLIFNGEIYNFRELRSELQGLGHTFSTSSDAEVLLKSYSHWGTSCVGRLRGMFAFAVWDNKRNQLFAARDRVGIKPLYFTIIDRPGGRKVVLIASQLRAILASGLVARRLDVTALNTYLWNGYVIGPNSLVRGVQILPGGSTLTVSSDGSVSLDRYWSIPRATSDGDPRLVRQRLEESIEQHMVSDVPLGIFLSGGKDSSAVATLASRISSKPVRTFTITFNEAQYNEAAYAKRVADFLKSDHTEVLLTEDIFRNNLDNALASIDQPTFDGINSFFVSRAVKAAGATVALAGTGGDELFGGYRTFRDLPWVRRWTSRLSFLPSSLIEPSANAFSRLMAINFSGVPPQTRWGRLSDALSTDGNLTELYQVAYGLFTRSYFRRLAAQVAEDQVSFGLPLRRKSELEELVEGQPDLHAISALELTLFTGERLLRDTDAASMESSLEVRVPLLDHLVIEALFQLPQDRRFVPVREKPLLREAAMWDLPDYIFDRPKLGFELPLDVWCRHGLRSRVEKTLENRELCSAVGLDPDTVRDLWRGYQKGVPGLYWSRVWVLFVLLWWCETHEISLH